MTRASKIVLAFMVFLMGIIVALNIIFYKDEKAIMGWLFPLTIAGGLTIYCGGLLLIWYIEDKHFYNPKNKK